MFTDFDVIVITTLLTCIVACYRVGFFSVAINMVSYLVIFFVVLTMYDNMLHQASKWFSSEFLMSFVSVTILFFVTFFLIMLLRKVSQTTISAVKGSGIDKSLGFIYGLLMGYFIIGIFHIIAVKIEGGEPEWLKDGSTYELTQSSNRILDSIFNGKIYNALGNLGNKASGVE